MWELHYAMGSPIVGRSRRIDMAGKMHEVEFYLRNSHKPVGVRVTCAKEVIHLVVKTFAAGFIAGQEEI